MAQADRCRPARGEEQPVSQQINLYAPLFRRQKKVFSAVALLQAMGIVVLAVAAFYIFVAMRTSVLRIEAADSAEQLKKELERLKVLSAAESPAQREKALAERRKQLEAAVAARTRALRALEEGALGRSKGYADTLRALARSTTNGVWLTRIDFSEDGGGLSLTGRATHAALVARYLERLRVDRALRAEKFATLEIRRQPPAEKRGTLVEFVLGAEAREANKK